MAVSYATTGPSIATGEIKWSTLRRSFKTIILRENFSDSDNFALDNNTITISASELLRDTDTTKSEDPIVGDATENAAVATSSDWAASQMRNTIKAWFVGQTGTDDNTSDGSVPGLDVVSMVDPTPWSSNLGKTIPKRLFITGVVGSSVPDVAALRCQTSTLRNLTIDVAGNVEAGGGNPNGGTGGSAIDLNTTTSTRVVVNVRAGAYISAGGGAGGQGGYGTYRYKSGTQCTHVGGFCGGCPGAYKTEWCRGDCGRGPNSFCSCCQESDVYSTATAVGGDGGVGAGYVNQTAGSGSGPSQGSGGTGGNGGERGVAGSPGSDGNSTPGPTAGGDPGRAIGPAGGSWSVTGSLIPGTTLVGLYIPQYIHCFIMKLDPKSKESADLVWKLFKRGNEYNYWLWLVDDDVFNQRMSICNACPEKNTRLNACNKCGCDLGYKLGWSAEQCPIGKWGETRESFDKRVQHMLTYLDQDIIGPNVGAAEPPLHMDIAVGHYFIWNFYKFTKRADGGWDQEPVDIENQMCYHSM